MDKKRRTLPVVRPAAPEPARRLRVVESGAETELPAPGEVLSVGSHPANQVAIDDRHVSAYHCDIQWHGERLVLRDKRSTNGTYVNGIRVHDCALTSGTRVRIGGTTLEILGEGAGREASAREQLVGAAPSFLAAIDLAIRAAHSSASVLIVGESGTGKELFARLVHERSPYRGPFVALNCGAIAPSLVASELFGHEKGAFTGAEARRHGVFEQAHGGTLFLDEIGELPTGQQPSLLRVLETRRLTRLGGEIERRVEVRVVAATHRDLRAGSGFRQDLYHRLAGMQLHLPPLRERGRDVEVLAGRFLAELAPPGFELTSRALGKLSAHTWPGNVRELRNVVQRLTLMGEERIDEVLQGEAVPLPVADAAPAAASLDDTIRHLVSGALESHGSHRKAAASLRMPKSTFYDKVRRYGVRARRR
jgi:DNA-binding NtrC family response regulator